MQIRLDKWLWAARLYKTRSLCREHIAGGKVHYNGQRSKPSKHVQIGATITLKQGAAQKHLIVTLLSTKRGNADVAKHFYKETEQSQLNREKIAQIHKWGALTVPHPERRPNKKERRHLIRFKQGN